MKKLRRRYLALKIEADRKFTAKELMDAVWNAFLRLYGEYGASQTTLALISYNEEERFAVIRTVHTTLRMVRAALASITSIGNVKAAVRILKVSGTQKALKKLKP